MKKTAEESGWIEDAGTPLSNNSLESQKHSVAHPLDIILFHGPEIWSARNDHIKAIEAVKEA